MTRYLLVLFMLLGAGTVHAQFPSLYLTRPVQDIAAGYSAYDINNDGIAEINSISLMSFEPAVPAPGSRGLALVLVDPRLLNAKSTALNSAMLSALRVHRDDLVREGYSVRTLLLDVYRGPQHQDGRTLLALRRFLQAVHSQHALKGVTLVGSFPEASLMRRVLERRVTNDDGLAQSLWLTPERINPRSEIVLADLNGNWEALYLPTFSLESLVLQVPNTTAFPLDQQTVQGTFTRYEILDGEDVFYLRDDFADRTSSSPIKDGPGTVFIASTAQRNPELTFSDRVQANPIARPEILVSRIDARGIAFNPTGPVDLHGRRPLDASGKPQALEVSAPQLEFVGGPVPAAGGSTTVIVENGLEWTRDPLLEQRILISYFDRNHQHRIGVRHASQYRVSSVQQYNSGLPYPDDFNLNVLRPADPAGFAPSLSFEQANLYHYAYWLKEPAILRGVLAHSDGRGSGFYNFSGVPQDTAYPLVDMMIGGRAWAWQDSRTPAGTKLRTPSAQAFRETAGWEFARTLWENRTLMYYGYSFYLHDGCSVTVPDVDLTTSYDDLRYGFKNNADSILLLQNGLAILARGKVFNDWPAGFGPSIRNAGGQFGAAWRGYFLTEASSGHLKPGTNGDERVLRNKKSYFWSLRGDWSLNLSY